MISHPFGRFASALLVLGLAVPWSANAVPAAPSAPDPGTKAAVQALSLASAINKSGRQRMLSMRMGKAWAMRALEVEPALTSKIADRSQALFAAQLVELATIVPTREIRAALAALTQAWQRYRADLALAPNPENAQRVYRSGDQTLARAHELTLLYEKQLGTAQGHLVNVAGRERMLSQRMARAYYFRQLDGGIDVGEDLDQARREFMLGLRELSNAPQNTEAIRQEIVLAEQQWLFFQRAIDNGSAYSKRDVATTSERILEQMDTLTAAYEQQSAR